MLYSSFIQNSLNIWGRNSMIIDIQTCGTIGITILTIIGLNTIIGKMKLRISWYIELEKKFSATIEPSHFVLSLEEIYRYSIREFTLCNSRIGC